MQYTQNTPLPPKNYTYEEAMLDYCCAIARFNYAVSCQHDTKPHWERVLACWEAAARISAGHDRAPSEISDASTEAFAASWDDYQAVPNGWHDHSWDDYQAVPNGWSNNITMHFTEQQFQNKIQAVKNARFNMLRTDAAGAHGEREPPQGWAAAIAEGLMCEDAVYQTLIHQGHNPTKPNVTYEPFYKDRMPDMCMTLNNKHIVVHVKSATAKTWQLPKHIAKQKGAVFQWKSRNYRTRFNKGANKEGGFDPINERVCFGITQRIPHRGVNVTLSNNIWLTPLGECIFEGMNNGNPNKRCVKDYHF